MFLRKKMKNFMTLEKIPLEGFRINLRFDVDSWVLKNGIRYSNNNHRGLSNDFRIIPDDKKGFKIVLGKRSPTDKEKVWLVSDTNPNYIFNLMFSVYRSMEDGNFLKMFLEELYRLNKKGPTYSEYIKNPKKYKNFVSVYRERLEYLKNHAPEETMNVLGHADSVEPLYETFGTPAFSQAVGAPIESACCEITTQPSLMSF